MRIVSLSPAATEIVAAFGASGRLVGVSHECDYPPEVCALPRVTRLRSDSASARSGGGSASTLDRAAVETPSRRRVPAEIDVELLARLRPDVIIGQAACEACAVGDLDLARIIPTLGHTPWVVTLHPHTLVEVFVDIRKLGEPLELRDEADELIAGLAYRLRRVRRAVERASSGAGRPRVLVLEWLDPPYVAGLWVPELVEAAGGDDIAGMAGVPAVSRSWRELSALPPDLVVVAPSGGDVQGAERELATIADRDARTLLGRRVEFLDGRAYTSRPGPRLVDAAELLARLIHR